MNHAQPNEAERLATQVFVITIAGVFAYGLAVLAYVLS
jgi:hypothetical protein